MALIVFIYASCEEEKCEEYLPPQLSIEPLKIYSHTQETKKGFITEMTISNSKEKCVQVATDINLIASVFYKPTIGDKWQGIILSVVNGATGEGANQFSEIQAYNPSDMMDMYVIPISDIAPGKSIIRKEFFRPDISGYFKVKYKIEYNDKNDSNYIIEHSTDSIYIESGGCTTIAPAELYIPHPFILKLDNSEENGFKTFMQLINKSGFCRQMAQESKIGLSVYYWENVIDGWQQKAIEMVNDTCYNIQNTNTSLPETINVKQLLPGNYEVVEKFFYTNTKGVYKIKYFIDIEGVVNEEVEENNTGETEQFYVGTN